MVGLAVSFIFVCSLLWTMLLTKESQLRELKADAELFKFRSTTLLRGWNATRLWVETWMVSYVLAAGIKTAEHKFIGRNKESGWIMFMIVVGCELFLGWMLSILLHSASRKTQRLLLKQTFPQDYDERVDVQATA